MTSSYRRYTLDGMNHEHGRTVKGSAERIRAIRENLGLSQSQMARRLGVAPNTVARWEREYLVPPRVAELAAEYLLLTERTGGQKNAKGKR